MAFACWRTAHDAERHIEREAEGFTQHGGFSGQRVQGNAHVVVNKLHADAHTWPTCVYQFIAHRHQHWRGTFNLLRGAASQKK